jgi:riboflavin synthase
MFTGIIEETGPVTNIQKNKNGWQLTIKASQVLAGTKTGDSIAVNGVCLTVVRLTKTELFFDVMAVTGEDSLTGSLKKGTLVNLERALAADGRLGGHFVSGHVDGTGKIKKITKKNNLYELTIEYDKKYSAYAVNKGSIAIDGISLTIQNAAKNTITLGIIPHTLENTSLKVKKEGDSVNLEFDILAKYLEKMVGQKKETSKKNINKFMLG